MLTAHDRIWKQARDYRKAMRALDAQCRSAGPDDRGPAVEAEFTLLLPRRLVDAALDRLARTGAATQPELVG